MTDPKCACLRWLICHHFFCSLAHYFYHFNYTKFSNLKEKHKKYPHQENNITTPVLPDPFSCSRIGPSPNEAKYGPVTHFFFLGGGFAWFGLGIPLMVWGALLIFTKYAISAGVGLLMWISLQEGCRSIPKYYHSWKSEIWPQASPLKLAIYKKLINL